MSTMGSASSAAFSAAGLLLAGSVSLAQSAVAAEYSALVENYRRQLDSSLEQKHISPASIDRDGLLRDLEQRAASGESQKQLGEWLSREMIIRWLSFAPVAPAHRDDDQFDLPFDRRINWIVGQGVSGSYSHTGREEFSFDFAMPEGTPVLAARGGKVVRVVDGFTRCALPRERGDEANVVYVLHADGTFAHYVHLRPGIPVKEGQSIGAHELIAYSGCTGYAAMPHLHFDVSIRDSSISDKTIPIRFRNETPQGYVPKHWRLYQNRPAATALLGVVVDGRPLVSGKPFDLRGRAPIQLQVFLAGPSGEAIDITHDPGTRYVALTPWSLRVGRDGRVAFGFQSRQWEPMLDVYETSFTVVTILYEGADGRQGAFDAWVRFPDAARYLKPEPERKAPDSKKPDSKKPEWKPVEPAR